MTNSEEEKNPQHSLLIFTILLLWVMGNDGNVHDY